MPYDESGAFYSEKDLGKNLVKLITDRLKDGSVPKDRWPSSKSILSHLSDWLDMEKVNKWVEKYVELEKEIIMATPKKSKKRQIVLSDEESPGPANVVLLAKVTPKGTTT